MFKLRTSPNIYMFTSSMYVTSTLYFIYHLNLIYNCTDSSLRKNRIIQPRASKGTMTITRYHLQIHKTYQLKLSLFFSTHKFASLLDDNNSYRELPVVTSYSVQICKDLYQPKWLSDKLSSSSSLFIHYPEI